MKLMYEPGSYSVNISTERSVTSLRHDGASARPVSVSHDQESGDEQDIRHADQPAPFGEHQRDQHQQPDERRGNQPDDA